MQVYPVKADGVSSLGATEYNDYASGELNNFVQESGQTLSSGNPSQMGVGVANYAAHGDFYTDSGSADVYVLATQASKKGPNAYVDGMNVRFKVGNTNTGASTINVNSLGSKDIKSSAGSVLVAGQLVVGEYVTIFFDSSNNYFILVTALANNNVNVSIKTTGATLTSIEDVILADATSAGFTITLPPAATNDGKIYKIKKTDSTNNIVIIDGNASETIDGALTKNLATQYEQWEIVSDGANWQVMAHKTDTDWVAYTPSADQGFGTITSGEYFYRRSGDSYDVKGRFTAGTVTGDEARIELPFSKTSDSTKLDTTLNVVGGWAKSDIATVSTALLIEPSVSYVTFGVQSSVFGGISKRLGSQMINNNEDVSFFANGIPISGFNA